MAIVIRDAKGNQESVIKNAHSDSLVALQKIIRLLAGTPPARPKKFSRTVEPSIDSLIEKYFGPFVAPELEHAKQKILQSFRRVNVKLPDVIYEVISVDLPFFEFEGFAARKRASKTIFGDNTIYLNKFFFQNPKLYHFKTIIHEALHLYCGIDDREKKIKDILTESSKLSLDNAYAYGNFSFEIYKGIEDPDG